jgi:hypothetical protein
MYSSMAERWLQTGAGDTLTSHFPQLGANAQRAVHCLTECERFMQRETATGWAQLTPPAEGHALNSPKPAWSMAHNMQN